MSGTGTPLAQARTLLRSSLDMPGREQRIGDDEQLAEVGIDSGEMLQLVAGLEHALDRELADDEMEKLSTLRGIADLLSTDGSGHGA